MDFTAKTNAINCLRKRWLVLEKYSILHIFSSQISKFTDQATHIKVVAREDYVISLMEEINKYFKFVEVS